MHELSIAKGIMANLRPWLDEQPESLRVEEIVIKCGPFRAVVASALVAAWEVVRAENPKTAESRLTIDNTSIKIHCNDCGVDFDARRPIFKCRKCDSDNLAMSGGNELFIENIKTNSEE
ncbi:MAG TPA: hydrogenase maturation nickel metallochaperone HypA [candidate division Zixibacteria bacterium]|nr:hydrogenase maturation nickel metallochaperone HypA [candidate division Zixibacteria bacterium]